jgi:hypothetical protein
MRLANFDSGELERRRIALLQIVAALPMLMIGVAAAHYGESLEVIYGFRP